MTAARPHEYYEEMAAAHVLGALDEGDRGELMSHLRTGCSICQVIYPQLCDVADLLLLGAAPTAPPVGLKARILAAAAEAAAAGGAVAAEASHATVDRPAPAAGPSGPSRRLEPRDSGRERLYLGLALAASLAFVLLGLKSMAWRNDLDIARQVADARGAELTRLQDEVRGLETTRAEQAALLELLERPASGLVTLASLEPAPGASGKVLYDAALGKGYLWVRNLPVDADGKDYQLWAIQGGAPVSAGVFSVSADGSAVIPLSDVTPDTRVAAFAITLEPAGGLPAPSGPMVLLGNAGS